MTTEELERFDRWWIGYVHNVDEHNTLRVALAAWMAALESANPQPDIAAAVARIRAKRDEDPMTDWGRVHQDGLSAALDIIAEEVRKVNIQD